LSRQWLAFMRDLGDADLAKELGRVGYRIVRQSGSHLRLTTEQGRGQREGRRRHE
jgi:predicted RNA binding protein YcfA (HicA-like mRNA interferase family)